ncbi:hypothetical protein [Nostoc sphaeroides]|uniref:Uncharacterized protein n=1 Tax=Nostoc sphaeroides CCNUC1 TaxID=2653204 RepID=A0A5P8WGU6_9NOSO|nr:hypothetical protein [Nostoc sphaeroides]QFS52025.1 hypothetical protein GXM_09519 [Nostoc sphaeroides CCNUC1]
MNYLHTILESYHLGKTKTIEVVPGLPDDSIDECLSRLIRTRLPSTDRLLMHKFGNARQRGLLAARRGDLMVAEKTFGAARFLLELNKLSTEGSLLYLSFLEQAESYLDYRRGDFEQARNRIYHALAVDVTLEEEHEYDILLLHRIQLVHNLVRIDARCMNLERAIELACQILGYLQGKLEVLPIPGNWGYERVLRQRQEFVGAMFAQVTSEVALILAGKNPQAVRDLLAVASTNLRLQINGNCHLRANAWLLIKQAFASNNIALFLKRVSQFLSEGCADTPLLWYATVIDLIVVCEELDLPDSELFTQEVARDAASWEHLPQKFSSLLGVHPKTEAA